MNMITLSGARQTNLQNCERRRRPRVPNDLVGALELEAVAPPHGTVELKIPKPFWMA